MQSLLDRISEKKATLDSFGLFPKELTSNLYEWFKVALTYSSNAIEGNTLTLAETAQVVEKRLTVANKSINEHLEAINHAQAVDFIRDLAQTKTREQLTLDDILALHTLILQKINNEWAGRLRVKGLPASKLAKPPVLSLIEGEGLDKRRRVSCPNYLKVPVLMNELVYTMHNNRDHIATIAADIHLSLVAIHPFVDGNGRTARLLMNLLLLQEQYPLVIIDVKDRATYIQSIQKALQGDTGDYYALIYTAIEHSLDEYIKAAQESDFHTR